MTVFHGLSRRRWICRVFGLTALAIGSVCAVTQANGQRHAAEGRPKTTAASPAAGPEERIHAIETTAVDIPMGEKEAPLRLSLLQLMELYKVPALSIAVIDDYKIVWAKGYGTIGMGSGTPVGTHTLFQAGSISKPVAATGALYLVEHGKLVLDEDVNAKLKTWKVPENEFTKEQKVTLRRLMSHTGGLTIHGFPGYDVDAPVPTLVQIFNGEKPANTDAIRVDILPGTQERYSGGGVTIEQQMMIDVTGKAFPELMREIVLDKIGMTDSSYEQPLPAARAAMTANGTYMDGKPVHGRWHIYPEMAAAGLWTTPTDLAKFAIEIANSRHGKSNRVLSQKLAEEMLTPVLEEAGLGLFVEKANPGQFGHNGADEGFQALLTMNSETGKGLAIMADSDNGLNVANLVLRRVAKEYAWNYKFGSEMPALVIVARVRGTQAALDRYAALKNAGELAGEHAEGALNQLGYTLLYSGHEKEAIQIFQRNVQEFPQSSNVYDSLGEAYMKVGEKDLAIANYEKSLQLDPKNQNAVEQLKKLRAPK
ncbi:MAG TPA: serine hydrolase [Candidatus Angelobacter sp.]|nr:serine hydrolase [Candidatus Angelobacter sp.]